MENVLTIAGSDPSGGAGIQADLKTMCALGAFGMSAITALTVQNTLEVRAVHETPPEIVAGQIDAVYDDIRVDAVKVGMVANPAIARVVRERMESRRQDNLVVDPVMVSKSGCRLIDDDAVRETILLMRRAALVTPNLMEAALLADMEIRDHDGMREAARRIHALGATNVMIKGGALEGDADDFLFLNGEETWLRCPRIKTRNTHGTGCTLSAAIACFLARGETVGRAAKAAKDYVTRAIRDGLDIGHGVGPLGHMTQLYDNAEKKGDTRSDR